MLRFTCVKDRSPGIHKYWPPQISFSRILRVQRGMLLRVIAKASYRRLPGCRLVIASLSIRNYVTWLVFFGVFGDSFLLSIDSSRYRRCTSYDIKWKYDGEVGRKYE